jgi:hypothetical protein
MSSKMEKEAGHAFHIEAALNHGVEEKATGENFVHQDEFTTTRNMMTSEDGKTILVPQPSDHPDDPLNWSSVKKHSILLSVAAISFLPNYGSATGATVLEAQAMQVYLHFFFFTLTIAYLPSIVHGE